MLWSTTGSLLYWWIWQNGDKRSGGHSWSYGTADHFHHKSRSQGIIQANAHLLPHPLPTLSSHSYFNSYDYKIAGPGVLPGVIISDWVSNNRLKCPWAEKWTAPRVWPVLPFSVCSLACLNVFHYTLWNKTQLCVESTPLWPTSILISCSKKRPAKWVNLLNL